MQFQHGAIYLFSRGIPGLVGFATVVILTRLLSPEAYGEYALVVTAAVLANAVLYQWISSSLLRFLPESQSDEQTLLATVFCGFLLVSAAVIVVAAMLHLSSILTTSATLIMLAVGLTISQAWFTVNLELTRGRLSPVRYGAVSAVKAIVALSAGVGLVLVGFGSAGALFGLAAGFLLAGLLSSWGQWPATPLSHWNRPLARELLLYGLPLSVSFTLGTIISSSDRFMLTWLIDESATGYFFASQTIVQQAIITVMTAVHLAAYPLILRAMENEGAERAVSELRKNAMLLFGIGFPACMAFLVLSEDFASIFLGREFRSSGLKLIPWFAITTLIWCSRSYYFDLAFFIARKPRRLAYIMAFAALLNIVLNIVLIPRFGILGAAYASAASHFAALVLSAIVGRSVFQVPMVGGDLARLAFATAVMTVPLFVIPVDSSFVMLSVAGLAALTVYVAVLYLVDLGDVRKFVNRFVSLSGA
ncbi:MAG: oligosaccharide flippase family protein [Pseudomonadota bacterium]